MPKMRRIFMLASMPVGRRTGHGIRAQAQAPLASRTAWATFVACDTRPIFAPATIFLRRVLGRGAMPSLEVNPAGG
jgi:hypothetical protein